MGRPGNCSKRAFRTSRESESHSMDAHCGHWMLPELSLRWVGSLDLQPIRLPLKRGALMQRPFLTTVAAAAAGG